MAINSVHSRIGFLPCSHVLYSLSRIVRSCPRCTTGWTWLVSSSTTSLLFLDANQIWVQRCSSRPAFPCGCLLASSCVVDKLVRGWIWTLLHFQALLAYRSCQHLKIVSYFFISPLYFTFLDKQIRYLGKGAFGEVILVQHKVTGKQYAMKQSRVTNNQMTADQKAEKTILQDYSPKFTSPFIVRLYDLIEGKNLCLFIDYCGCGSLRDRIRFRQDHKLNPFPENVCLSFSNHILIALIIESFVYTSGTVAWRCKSSLLGTYS